MAIFKEKTFGLLVDTLKGAAVGAGIGGGLARFKLKGKDSTEINVASRKIQLNLHLGVIGGAIIGGALGLLASAIKTVSNHVNRKITVNNRLLSEVTKALEQMGHREGMSFTRDPKTADILKTKASLVIYKYSDELRVIVNTANDSKLALVSKQITDKIAKQKEISVVNEVISNNGKFRDIKITAISDPSTDVNQIVWIVSTFIKNGYPVYLVEVG